MTFLSLKERSIGRYQRFMCETFYRSPVKMRNREPLISFSFDDFPRSAFETGGAILKSQGLRATYYAALGLMGQESPVGRIFSREDLGELQLEGHELGCHTFGHCDAWITPPNVFEQSIVENKNSLKKILPGVLFRTHSYPIDAPRPQTKRLAAEHFNCCRTGGQTNNVGIVDRGLLRAYFLERSRHDPDSVREIIDKNSRAGGWLIFATHDVCETPTQYGCNPSFFEDIVLYASRSGAKILPIGEAWEIVSSKS
jgi:peptidoglycan/xylan/chitin deacetylase (PgdA/CDA1 family)